MNRLKIVIFKSTCMDFLGVQIRNLGHIFSLTRVKVNTLCYRTLYPQHHLQQVLVTYYYDQLRKINTNDRTYGSGRHLVTMHDWSQSNMKLARELISVR